MCQLALILQHPTHQDAFPIWAITVARHMPHSFLLLVLLLALALTCSISQWKTEEHLKKNLLCIIGRASSSCFFHIVYLLRHFQSPTYLYNSCECTSYLLSCLCPLEEAEDVSSTKKQKSKFIIRLKLLSHSTLKNNTRKLEL